MMTSDIAVWRREFGEAWEVPAAITAHPEVVDSSWHNDTCPSFERIGNPSRRLLVDHPILERREFSTADRFTVIEGDDARVIYESETDYDTALHILLTGEPIETEQR